MQKELLLKGLLLSAVLLLAACSDKKEPNPDDFLSKHGKKQTSVIKEYHKCVLRAKIEDTSKKHCIPPKE